MPGAKRKSNDTITLKAFIAGRKPQCRRCHGDSGRRDRGRDLLHGTNDYDEGMARTAAAPEYLYVLGFSPLDLKLDGRYHNLKVTLKNPKPPGLPGADLQVRKGYYAPKYAADPAGTGETTGGRSLLFARRSA